MRSPIQRAFAGALCLLATCFGSINAQSVAPSSQKPWIVEMLVAYVWPNGYSEIWVMDSPFATHIVSNVDFSIFGSTVTVETADAVHDFIVVGAVFGPNDVLAEQMSGEFDARGVPKYWPSPLPPPTKSGQYVAIPNSWGPPTASEVQVLDALHRYYQVNRGTLEAQAAQRAIDAQRIASQKATIPPHTGPPVKLIRVEAVKPTSR